MYAKTDIHASGVSAEDNLKFLVANQLSRERYDQSLYFEAARRVVFRNCMAKCEVTDKELPNFNKNFYYS